MFSWPNWLYKLWAVFLRCVLVPLSIPIRIIERIVGDTYPPNNVEKYRVRG